MRSGGKLAAFAVAAMLALAAKPAAAETFYTINGQPATPDIAYYMATHGVPSGQYWLNQMTGYWGAIGNPDPLGNIYGRRVGLATSSLGAIKAQASR